ncbi:MAG TPA: 50S ribosomal protein L24 [Ignisphaera sp.]|uniref:Large ribosomal subunit protein eL24 n=1 Tax=Ignisphaera aggregans TaxID=334771 RepID=A0A832YXR9_9CREN|nr:50S ribosomal protein L24 [Ignisphaera sp.]HIP56502.1 50S ribosomal protein L24 [Ignisphaera aggregans]
MVTRKRCSFCGKLIEPGTGLMYVKNDGTIYWFCSSKCFKSYKMGRDPKKLPWTLHYMSKR